MQGSGLLAFFRGCLIELLLCPGIRLGTLASDLRPTHVLAQQHRENQPGQDRQDQRNPKGRPRGYILKGLGRLEEDAGQPRQFTHARRLWLDFRYAFRRHISRLYSRRPGCGSPMMEGMPRYAALALLSLALCACKPSEEGHAQAIIGAVLIDGAGGPPLSNSVVVVSGGRIRAAGPPSNIPIPADADKIDGAGKFVVPLLVDVCDSTAPPGLLHPDSPADARAQVAVLAARKATAIHIGTLPPAVAQGVFEAAREAHIPVTGHISTQAEARFLVDKGASVLVGMIRDTEDLDPVLVARLRDLRIVVAPSLGNAGAAIEIARHNTRRLFQAGVLLAVASEGGDPLREAELMVEAGVPPLDVIVAATSNGAIALHQLEDRGTIEAERRADLLLVSANPAEDIKNLRRVALRMVAGEWGR